jgi:hypothetical protein
MFKMAVYEKQCLARTVQGTVTLKHVNMKFILPKYVILTRLYYT